MTADDERVLGAWKRGDLTPAEHRIAQVVTALVRLGVNAVVSFVYRHDGRGPLMVGRVDLIDGRTAACWHEDIVFRRRIISDAEVGRAVQGARLHEFDPGDHPDVCAAELQEALRRDFLLT